ncbi:S53 family peptidase [Ferrimicrobium sp.]|uniref:S53 family peptidase n=1 Tax=Ferrimicrobium sp. TaxID=2926050 RepID=UPI002632AA02|nr:S53 family peptidase [Ferrimicrobium sp.]
MCIGLLLPGTRPTSKLVDDRAAVASAPIHFEVVLRPRDQTQLMADAWRRSERPGGQYLTPAQFGRLYAQTPANQDQVSDYFQDYGLTTGSLWPGGLVMPVEGTVADASAALGVSFDQVHLSGGRDVVVADAYPKLPQLIGELVVGVTGLFANGYFPVTPKGVLASGSGACAGLVQKNSPSAGFSPATVASYYHLSRSRLRHSITIGVAEFGEVTGSLDRSVARFAHCLRDPVHLATVAVNGGSDNTTRASLDEMALDLETLVAYAPGAHLLVYTASSGDADALYLQMVSQDRASILLTTWGSCEEDTPPRQLTIEELAFAEAALQGQTVVAASGDDGSSDCLATGGGDGLSVDDPASQPMVTAVGGEQFTTPISQTARPSAWNDQTYAGASGGGVSSVFAEPPYQRRIYGGVAGIRRLCRLKAGCRLVPDVAMIAVGGEIYVPGGRWTLLGGTSLAASVFAAGIAEVEAHAGVRLGLLNPRLYRLATHSSAFTPVRLGDNDFRGLHPGQFQANGRFSLATGLGTPNFAVLARALLARGLTRKGESGSSLLARGAFHLREVSGRF